MILAIFFYAFRLFELYMIFASVTWWNLYSFKSFGSTHSFNSTNSFNSASTEVPDIVTPV